MGIRTFNNEYYDKLPLSDFRPYFSSLVAPDIQSLSGFFQGQLTGPSWLRLVNSLYMDITGLGGWLGKEFGPGAGGINRVKRGSEIKRVLPFRLLETASRLDGKPVVALYYLDSCPFPWPIVTDEFRLIQPGFLMGMSYHDLAGLDFLVAPFFLVNQEAANSDYARP